jgi:hypothetical protein
MVRAEKAEIMKLLTDPEACARWSPIPFELEQDDVERLVAGSSIFVSGSLLGRSIGFEIDVREAGGNHVDLTATGPFSMDVEYELADAGPDTELTARVAVRSGRGLLGRLLPGATETLLAGGMLQRAVERIAAEASAPQAAFV